MFASCNFLLSALLCDKSWRGWHGSHPNYQPESLWKKNQQFELDTHQTQSIWYEVPLNHLMQSGFMQAPRRGRILQLIPQTSGIVHLQALCPFINSTCFLTFNTCFVVGTGSLEVFTIFVFFFFLKTAIVEKSQLHQHHPPHPKCGWWNNSGGTGILENFNLN